MRHPYVGDVGDFGKYGLLRALHQENGSQRLGVVWYLTDAEEHNKDGKHDGYLTTASEKRRAIYRDCDPELYDVLRAVRKHRQLNIEMMENGNVLHQSTAFFGTSLPVFRGRVREQREYKTRWEQREKWHSAAVHSMKNSACVFTDPDNGILFASRDSVERRKPSHKHAYWHEIAGYLSLGMSVVAYHHLGRQRGGHSALIKECLRKIGYLGFDAWAVHYRRGTGRAFVVIPEKSSAKQLLNGTRQFVAVWKEHAGLVTL
ncbi:MAG: hypothetical protein K8T91_10970 [Planctomycetes bacterium]|nr:hypothetical protein [Planctomycetota bacterium]